MNCNDLSYLGEPERTNGLALQAKMLELQAAGIPDTDDILWVAAVEALGNGIEKYCNFYACLQCGDMYHSDHSSNTDPDRDFCGIECEWHWLQQNPDEPYNGALLEEEE